MNGMGDVGRPRNPRLRRYRHPTRLLGPLQPTFRVSRLSLQCVGVRLSAVGSRANRSLDSLPMLFSFGFRGHDEAACPDPVDLLTLRT
jgi:hypothetical protein